MKLSGMEFINEIIQTMLHTSMVAGTKPVSCLLVGPSGGGKSQTVIPYKAPWIHHTNDLTSAGLSDILSNDVAGKLRTIILPDFNVPLSHKSAVVTLTVSNLLSLMSEGTCRIDDGRNQKIMKHEPMSIISGLTPEMYQLHFKKWKALGFIRRFMMVNYIYSLETRRDGNSQIRDQKITSANLPDIIVDKSKDGIVKRVKLDKKEATDIEILSGELANNLGYNLVRDGKTHKAKWIESERALEFAPHLMLQSIAKGNALRMHRTRVNQSDIKFLISLLGFTNPARPQAI